MPYIEEDGRTVQVGDRRIVTVEFVYDGCDSNDSWVERRIREEFSGVSDVRVIEVRPVTSIVPEEVVVIPEYETPNYRWPSIYSKSTVLPVVDCFG